MPLTLQGDILPSKLLKNISPCSASTHRRGQPAREVGQTYEGHPDSVRFSYKGPVHVLADHEILPLGMVGSEGAQIRGPEHVCRPLALDGEGRLPSAFQDRVHLVAGLVPPAENLLTLEHRQRVIQPEKCS